MSTSLETFRRNGTLVRRVQCACGRQYVTVACKKDVERQRFCNGCKPGPRQHAGSP